ncbi:hypothetical protein M2152_000178 [Microbacteriaceae bacterium SG_E_30_P1]|uniref:Uncharacterized protein n=1 Tax=Antiquaquibacter oligotrophicus TaxID=2880260 RepID=A0ABT6KJY3_9MICO|nr:hypothetical protein [Antiquaquibacter oligotrophicus]MDH6179996.1 hypothetical protein [Antiquaquibacter oligotrophicus]UDF14248.1 hypothetical protein LH407_05140 [Antiquaquibacter oligotrophicus]
MTNSREPDHLRGPAGARRGPVVLAILLSVLVLAGVIVALVFFTSGNADPAPTTGPSPSATVAPTPTPAPTPSASTDPSASWTFESGSFGPITLGGDGVQTGANLGWAPSTASECFTVQRSISGVVDPVDPRWVIGYGAFTDGRGIQWIDLRSVGNVGSLSPDAPRTNRGIGIGSTEDELVAAYPEAIVTTDTGSYREYAVAAGDGTYLHFGLGTDLVVFRLITDSLADSASGSYGC